MNGKITTFARKNWKVLALYGVGAALNVAGVYMIANRILWVSEPVPHVEDDYWA